MPLYDHTSTQPMSSTRSHYSQNIARLLIITVPIWMAEPFALLPLLWWKISRALAKLSPTFREPTKLCKNDGRKMRRFVRLLFFSPSDVVVTFLRLAINFRFFSWIFYLFIFFDNEFRNGLGRKKRIPRIYLWLPLEIVRFCDSYLRLPINVRG